HRPRPDEHVPVGVGQQAEAAPGVALVGPRPGDDLGQLDLGGDRADALLGRLRRGQTDGGDLRVAEHDPGDALVAGPAVAPEDVVGHDPPLVLGDVGEGGDAGDVADRPQAVPRPTAVVDGDGAVVAQGRAGVLEAQARGAGPAPGGQHDDVAPDLAAALQLEDGVVAVAPGPARAGAQADVDPRGAEVVGGERADPRLLPPEQPVAALDDGDGDAEAGEEQRGLDRHRAAADDHGPAGQVGGGVDVAAGPVGHAVQALDRRYDGLGPGGHDDVRGDQLTVADPHPARAGQAGGPLHDLGALRPVAVDLGRVVEVAYHLVAVGADRFPGQPGGAHAVDPGRLADHRGRPEHGLRRDARAVGALAADQLALDGGHPPAGAQQALGDDLAAGPHPHDHGIEGLGHAANVPGHATGSRDPAGASAPDGDQPAVDLLGRVGEGAGRTGGDAPSRPRDRGRVDDVVGRHTAGTGQLLRE